MKYRIIKSYWVGRSGKVYEEYIAQEKGLFWWSNIINSGFASVEEVEKFIEMHKTNHSVVKELE